MNILVFGDSIASGFWDTRGGWSMMLGERLHQRTIDTEGEEWYEVHNLGFGGETTEDLEERIGSELEFRDRIHDNFLIIQVGINDSKLKIEDEINQVSREEFRQNVQNIIEKAREHSTIIVMLGITPVDESRTEPIPWEDEWAWRNDEIRDYEKILEEVADEKQIEFIPLFEELDTDEWREKLWDGIHPNTEGHRRIYEIVRDPIFSQIDFEFEE